MNVAAMIAVTGSEMIAEKMITLETVVMTGFGNLE
jgi:hypothetical protein|tara:strand:+ start:629 stop:733 length:105 start_codon:yes stop_codon:yes gene_type:complete